MNNHANNKTGTKGRRKNGINAQKRIRTGISVGECRVTKKITRIRTALLALTLGLCTAAPAVRAEAAQTTGTEQAVQAAESAAVAGTNAVQATESDSATQADGAQTAKLAATRTDLSSRGSLVYQQGEKGAHIYAADFFLLRDRLDTIPDTVFEPACYTHTHQWEYRDIDEKTHTRHCDSCGSAFDLVSAHKADRRENCSIAYDGEEYPGIRYTCACGYQWELEETHTPFFEAVGESGHRSGCLLDGTKFCPGYEPVTEEHYAYYYRPCADGSHHEKICMDCGYSTEEECCFDLFDTDGDWDSDDEDSGNGSESGENDSGSEDGSDTGTDVDSGTGSNGENNGEQNHGGLRCRCGNIEKPNAGTNADASVTADENENAGADDDSSGKETGGENGNAGTDDDSSDEETGGGSENAGSGDGSSDEETGSGNGNAGAGDDSSEEETGSGNGNAGAGDDSSGKETGGGNGNAGAGNDSSEEETGHGSGNAESSDGSSDEETAASQETCKTAGVEGKSKTVEKLDWKNVIVTQEIPGYRGIGFYTAHKKQDNKTGRQI